VRTFSPDLKLSDEYRSECRVSWGVKTLSSLFLTSALALTVLSSVSCMTTYDAYGRPVQSVDPGLAVAGIAAAGLIGYAAGDNDDHRHRSHNHHYRSNYNGGHSRQAYRYR
jgi:hypothetical protein